MSTCRLLIVMVAALCLAALGIAALGQQPARPPAVVLLTSGRVLTGQIRREDDRLVVMFDTGEIRLQRDDVRAICGSLDEAYRLQRGKLQPRDCRGHLELAQWCLQHELLVYAGEEIAIARKLSPRHPEIALLSRKLEAARRPPVQADPQVKPASQAAPPAAIASPETIATISPAQMETFTTKIQPLMANGCAAASCHGPNTTSRFQLVRPAVNRPIQNATTQSNLRAVLAQVDTEKPEDSPLLTVPLAPHGTSRRAIFGKPQQQQYQLLLAWVRDVAGKTEKASSSAPSVPDSSDPFGTGKPGDVPPTGQPRKASNGPPPTANIVDRLHERLQQGQPPHSSPSSQAPTAAGRSPKRHSAPEPFRPRDPFDAELFNRRFFPTAAAKKEAESPGPRPAEEVRAVPVGSGR